MMWILLALLGIVILIMVLCISDVLHEEMEREENKMFKPICYGAEGKDVMEIQKLLKAAGSSIKANGLFTIGMLTAVKSFQKKHGLAVTGKVDLKTMNKLKTYAKPEKAEKKAPSKAEKKPVKKAAR